MARVREMRVMIAVPRGKESYRERMSDNGKGCQTGKGWVPGEGRKCQDIQTGEGCQKTDIRQDEIVPCREGKKLMRKVNEAKCHSGKRCHGGVQGNECQSKNKCQVKE